MKFLVKCTPSANFNHFFIQNQSGGTLLADPTVSKLVNNSPPIKLVRIKHPTKGRTAIENVVENDAEHHAETTLQAPRSCTKEVHQKWRKTP
jgi:hypothetical protein